MKIHHIVLEHFIQFWLVHNIGKVPSRFAHKLTVITSLFIMTRTCINCNRIKRVCVDKRWIDYEKKNTVKLRHHCFSICKTFVKTLFYIYFECRYAGNMFKIDGSSQTCSNKSVENYSKSDLHSGNNI